MSAQPTWDDTSRSRLRPGLTYPVKSNQIKTLLRGSQARVSTLSWSVAHVNIHTELPVLDVYRGGDARAGYSGPPGHGWTRLSIFAVPQELKDEVAALLTAKILPQACQWIAEIPSRGNAWLASSHGLQYSLKNGELMREES